MKRIIIFALLSLFFGCSSINNPISVNDTLRINATSENISFETRHLSSAESFIGPGDPQCVQFSNMTAEEYIARSRETSSSTIANNSSSDTYTVPRQIDTTVGPYIRPGAINMLSSGGWNALSWSSNPVTRSGIGPGSIGPVWPFWISGSDFFLNAFVFLNWSNTGYTRFVFENVSTENYGSLIQSQDNVYLGHINRHLGSAPFLCLSGPSGWFFSNQNGQQDIGSIPHDGVMDFAVMRPSGEAGSFNFHGQGRNHVANVDVNGNVRATSFSVSSTRRLNFCVASALNIDESANSFVAREYSYAGQSYLRYNGGWNVVGYISLPDLVPGTVINRIGLEMRPEGTARGGTRLDLVRESNVMSNAVNIDSGIIMAADVNQMIIAQYFASGKTDDIIQWSSVSPHTVQDGYAYQLVLWSNARGIDSTAAHRYYTIAVEIGETKI